MSKDLDLLLKAGIKGDRDDIIERLKAVLKQWNRSYEAFHIAYLRNGGTRGSHDALIRASVLEECIEELNGVIEDVK